jgi:two-component system, NarL family, nitrate/nitrite response regulator NarL
MTPSEAQGIKLVIIDDHAMFRAGVASLLAKEADFAVVGSYGSAKEALTNLSDTRPSLILLDFDLGTEAAVEFAREVKARGYTSQILVVTAGINEQEALQLIQAGVSGILHKHNPPEVLCATIRQVAAGEVCLEKNYLKPLFRTLDQTRPQEQPDLTVRDKAILRYIFQGLSNKEIGGHLELSEGSVKACLRQLFQKLGVHTRAQLVKVAIEQYRDQL